MPRRIEVIYEDETAAPEIIFEGSWNRRLIDNLYFLLILTRKYKIYNHKEEMNHYNMGVFLEYFFCSITVIPAIFVLRENIRTSKKNIKLYVGS